MRSELGKLTLDKVFRVRNCSVVVCVLINIPFNLLIFPKERESLNSNIVHSINQASDDWGIRCLRYEIKDIQVPPRVKESMQMQVEHTPCSKCEYTVRDEIFKDCRRAGGGRAQEESHGAGVRGDAGGRHQRRRGTQAGPDPRLGGREGRADKQSSRSVHLNFYLGFSIDWVTRMNHAVTFVIEGLGPSLRQIHKAFNYVPADCVATHF